MKILIPVDGSSCSRRAQEFIVAHPAMFGPEHAYLALTVVPAVPPHAAAVVDKDIVREYYKEEACKTLDPVRRFFEENGCRVKTCFTHGRSAEVIAQTATEGEYDLIVMGSHGRTALTGLVTGSVTAKVLSCCKTPVLIVR